MVNKQKLYEDLMTSISKIVKSSLNEKWSKRKFKQDRKFYGETVGGSWFDDVYNFKIKIVTDTFKAAIFDIVEYIVMNDLLTGYENKDFSIFELSKYLILKEDIKTLVNSVIDNEKLDSIIYYVDIYKKLNGNEDGAWEQLETTIKTLSYLFIDKS